MAKRIIFLPTVQHTGTWFTIDFLRKNIRLDAFIEGWILKSITTYKNPLSQIIYGGESFAVDGTTLIQTHITKWQNSDGLIQRGFTPDSTLFTILLCSVPTILPLRDPLLSILTSRHRHIRDDQGADVMDLVHIWAQTARDFHDLKKEINPFYLPVDLLAKATPEQREVKLRQLLSFCGLPVATSEEHIKQTAARWIPVRPTADTTGYKRHYATGDVDYFKKLMGEDALMPINEYPA